MFTLKIKSLAPIELTTPQTLDIGKTILYGSNGSGKTSIIRALTYLLVPNESERRNLLYEVEVVESFAKLLGYADIVLCEDNKCAELRCNGVNLAVSETMWSRQYRVARVVGDYMFLPQGSVDPIHNLEDISRVITYSDSSPESEAFIDKVEKFLHDYYIELNIARFHGTYFKELVKDRYTWLPVALLPYGLKKAISILYALEISDIVSVEGFEAALHLDLMRSLLDFIDDMYGGKVIVIETHSGLSLRWGIAKGWSVYYVKRDSITPLTRLEDLSNIELFKKEVEALTL
uniref:ATP-binding protein n=1 Tax=Ignisphaera aggregans TaxID=334771 RepID=A0A7J2U1D5_9CREN